jgi:acetylglutamate kinase
MPEKEPLNIIKIGGNVLDDPAKLQAFLERFTVVEGKKMLVHGGGKIATQIGNQLQIESHYVGGRRITDAATLDLVTMVYGGLINKKLVAQLQALGCNALGLTGADANLMPATKRALKDGIDYGWAGDLKAADVNDTLLHTLLLNHLVPVFAPLTHNRQGQLLNTNADTVASALAVAMAKEYQVSLLYCFEKKGVLAQIEDEDSVIPEINQTNYEALKQSGKLFDGILPKIDNAFAAIRAGVYLVWIGQAEQVVVSAGGAPVGTKIMA